MYFCEQIFKCMPFPIDAQIVNNFFQPPFKTIHDLKVLQHGNGIRVSIEGTVKNVSIFQQMLHFTFLLSSKGRAKKVAP